MRAAGLAERLAEVGVPLMPVGQPVRPLVHGTTSPASPWTTRDPASSCSARGLDKRWTIKNRRALHNPMGNPPNLSSE